MGMVIGLGGRTSGLTIVFLDIIGSDIQRKNLTFKKGDKVFSQNSAIDQIYCVVSGRVKLIRENIEGGSIVVHVAYAGESFSEASLFSDEYHCHCMADSSCELLSFPKDSVLKFLYQNPDAMMALIKNLTGQVRDLRLLGEIKSIYSAKSRIMAFLHSKANKSLFYYSYSLIDLAHKIGLTHETLYRNLTALENDGKIIKHDDCIELVSVI
jgi:CRP/FNR family transcriptional regulator, dissimilatory nitrate respiration regulator